MTTGETILQMRKGTLKSAVSEKRTTGRRVLSAMDGTVRSG